LMKFRSEFPNLPGFGKHSPQRPQSAPKNQSLKFVNGFMMVNSPLPGVRLSSPCRSPMHKRPMTASAVLSKEVESPNDVSGRYSFSRRQSDRDSNGFALPFCPASKLPSFLEHDRRVLLFNAYFEEDVLQSAVETKRIRICEIFFYVEDGTIEIIQTKQENSGIPQGVFLRRSKVEKPESQHRRQSGSPAQKPTYYDVNDFKIGNEVEIYGRKFRIVNCNDSTRQYVMDEQGWHEVDVAPLPFPRDSFAEMNKAKMRRESGVPGVDRKRKMNDLKEVMESMLGKQTSVTDRGLFLESGQDALCFHVVWDDRERLFGDVQFFKLFYYLADDTVEILPIYKKNDGRDPMPKFLKRISRLPKNVPTGKAEQTEYYSWEDFAIGAEINVLGRPMQIARCDKFTRDHYLSKGIVLNEDMDLEPEEEKVKIERQIPPYNGFGSEEDSLRSCTAHINPPPPKKDLAKMREKQGVILRFNAHLLSDKTEDETRRFVIQYFMEDDTIAIREPPIRNSGVMGGNFLRRQVIKKHDGTKYGPGDMYVGNIVDFVSHRFILLNADEYTYRLMENDERTFPYSNFSRLHEQLARAVDSIKQYFVARYSGDGLIDMSDFSACCDNVGLYLNKQEVLTLWRKLDKKNKGRISFTKVLKLAADDPFVRN